MRSFKIFVVLAVVALLAGACGSTEPNTTTTTPETTPTTTSGIGSFQPGELVSLDLPRLTADVADADVASVARGDALMGLALLGAVEQGDNVMLSPYSIATALSMLYAGASGSTADEIAAVLGLEVDPATLHAVRNYIDAQLAAVPQKAPEDDREPFTIRPANSAWGQGGFPFSEDYLRVLAENYGAGLRVVDFAGDTEGSRELINAWVEDTTEDRIKNLVPEGAVNVDTRLVLVNAIWFKANWANQFDPERTAPGEFTLLDGSTVTVPLMHASMRGQYAATDTFTAVRLPYAGDAAMVVLLPNEGVTPAELADSLTAADLDIQWGDYEINLTLPSFEFESNVALKRALQSIGMVEAFDPNAADLSGITDAVALFVQDALHKSFIAVDESGTEAAAATAIVVGLTSAPPPAEFTADRPFLFWIESTSTGDMLFLGQVTNPS